MVRTVVGVLLVLVGAVWFGQGVGVIGGSFMTGDVLWAVIGAPMVFVGALLIRSGIRTRGADDRA
jgi:uncharacterized membrane protein